MRSLVTFDNAREFIETNLNKENYFYQLHADGVVSFDLHFKMQFGNRLLFQEGFLILLALFRKRPHRFLSNFVHIHNLKHGLEKE